MKGKQLVVILILLAAIGGIALWLYERKATSWSKSATQAEGKILNFSLNDVAQITIRNNNTVLNLEKKGDGWKLRERNDYPANFDKVANLLRQLWELRPTQDVSVGPSQLGRLQLIEPGQESNSGTLIDLKGNGDQRLAALLLGKPHLREMGPSLNNKKGIPIGRYLMALDGSHRVFLVSEIFDEVQPSAIEWLNQTFITVENPAVIEINGGSAAVNWKLVRENNSTPWELSGIKRDEEIDATKASNLVAILTSLIFSDVLDPKTPPAETGLDKPALIRIETFDNFTYELRIGKLQDNNYPVLVTITANIAKERMPLKDEKPEEKTARDQQFQTYQTRLTNKFVKEKDFENWPYLISKAVIDRLLIPRSTLLAEKNKSPSPIPSAPKPNK